MVGVAGTDRGLALKVVPKRKGAISQVLAAKHTPTVDTTPGAHVIVNFMSCPPLPSTTADIVFKSKQMDADS